MVTYLGGLVRKLIAAFAFLTLLVLQAAAAQPPEAYQSRIVVLFKESGESDAAIVSSLASVHALQISKFHQYDLQKSASPHGKRLFFLQYASASEAASAIHALKKNPLVIVAEPDALGEGASAPNDPEFGNQWGLQKIQAPEAFDLQYGTPSTVIAVIDSGADLDHPDLVAKLLPSYDFIDNDTVPEDDNGHGTKNAGIAAAATFNGMGVAGTCPGCMILPVRAAYNNAQGGTSFPPSAVYSALEYATGNPGNVVGIPYNPNPADVISMSFVFSSNSSSVFYGINDAYSTGAVLVAAAGNNGNDVVRYPAAYDNVIAVAATDENDARPSWSNYGSWVDVAAPGNNIMTTYLNGGYAAEYGTSASAPFVAGTAALMRSRMPSLTHAQTKMILLQTDDPVSGFPAILGGRINAYNAILSTPTPPVRKPPKFMIMPAETGGE